MGYERAAWIGNLVLAGIGIALGWLPVSEQLGRWGTLAIALLVVLAAVALFPRKRADGSASRLIEHFAPAIRAEGGNVQVARDNANQHIESTRVINNPPKND